jgi:hypothetical protein
MAGRIPSLRRSAYLLCGDVQNAAEALALGVTLVPDRTASPLRG